MSKEIDPLYVVTGASAGIGRAVCVELCRRKMRVVAVARSADKLQSLADECGNRLMFVAADLATSAGVESVANGVAGEAKIHGIVHSAGTLVPLEPLHSINAGELSRHFQVHAAAPIALYQQLVDGCPIDRMLFVDSYSASEPRVGWAAYSIVKAATQMAARCAAAELKETRVARVFPGAVKTRIVDSILASNTPTAAVFADMVAAGKLADPAQAAEFLTRILLDATDELLQSREAWDYNSPEDRAALGY